jgi:hypothetical protein
MVALSEDQFQHRAPKLLYPLAIGRNLHPINNLRGARGHDLPSHLDDTQPTASNIAQPIQVTQRRDLDPIRLSHLKDRLPDGSAHVLPVDP